ncbi:hypothetical protein [Oricola sp.]|uniref:hypothetical protein n=1 Tax=Oricola sp. TaxID=1979950 RepID=UPI003BA8646B
MTEPNPQSTGLPPIKRRSDGSIDTDSYRRKAEALHGETVGHAGRTILAVLRALLAGVRVNPAKNQSVGANAMRRVSGI